jgi:dihydroflavonol-4-reductase
MPEGRALVMGASGFLGSHVVKALAAEGRDLRIFVRASSDTSAIDHLDLERTVGDVCDAGTLRQAMRGCSAIYYCAVDTRAWLKDPAPLRVTNVEGLRNVLDAAMDVGVERFVYTSTILTLGLNPSGVATEEDAFNWGDRATEYVRVRVEAEDLFFGYCARGLPGVACNIAMTYGAEDRQPTPHGWMITLVLRGLLPAWDASFPCVGIRDAADAMLLAEKYGRLGERYLIAERTLTLKEIWSIAVKAAGTPWAARVGDGGDGHEPAPLADRQGLRQQQGPEGAPLEPAPGRRGHRRGGPLVPQPETATRSPPQATPAARRLPMRPGRERPLFSDGFRSSSVRQCRRHLADIDEDPGEMGHAGQACTSSK